MFFHKFFLSLVISLCVCSLQIYSQDFFGGMGPADAVNRKPIKQKIVKVVSLPDKPNEVDAKGRKQGPWAKKHPNGRYAYEATFKDDKPVGTVKRYYESGMLAVEFYYDEFDSCHVTTYHPNRRIESKGVMFNQKREGVWTIYSDAGFPVGSISYVEGIKNGRECVFYEDGRLYESITWKDGRMEGHYQKHFSTGQTQEDATYHNDEFDGCYRSWGSDGKLVVEGVFKNGVKVGKWHVTYPEAGGLSVDILYDSHGLVINKAEVDSVENRRMEFIDSHKRIANDPEQFLDSPQDYVPFK